VAITCVLSMRGCEAFDKGGALAVEPQSFPSSPCVQEGQEILVGWLTAAPSAALPYAWERSAFWFRQLLNSHTSRAHRHPHAKERWGHTGIELGFFILPYYTAPNHRLYQCNPMGHHEPIETLKLLIPDLEHELSHCVFHLKMHRLQIIRLKPDPIRLWLGGRLSLPEIQVFTPPVGKSSCGRQSGKWHISHQEILQGHRRKRNAKKAQQIL